MAGTPERSDGGRLAASASSAAAQCDAGQIVEDVRGTPLPKTPSGSVHTMAARD
jgi:hypothetical protein